MGRAEIFAGDGEGYTLFVLLACDGELESSETPYTSADAFDPCPAGPPGRAPDPATQGDPSGVATAGATPRAPQHTRYTFAGPA